MNNDSSLSTACPLNPLGSSSGVPSQCSASSLALSIRSAVEGGADKGGLLPSFEQELMSTPRPQGAPQSFSSLLTDDLDAMLDGPSPASNSGMTVPQSSQAWPLPVPSNGVAMALSSVAQGISPLCPPLTSPSATSAASSASLLSPSHQQSTGATATELNRGPFSLPGNSSAWNSGQDYGQLASYPVSTTSLVTQLQHGAYSPQNLSSENSFMQSTINGPFKPTLRLARTLSGEQQALVQGGTAPSLSSASGRTKTCSKAPKSTSKARNDRSLLPKTHVCNVCFAAFARNHDLRRHGRIHMANKPYACAICQRQFTRKDALNRHLTVKSGCHPADSSTGKTSPSSLGSRPHTKNKDTGHSQGSSHAPPNSKSWSTSTRKTAPENAFPASTSSESYSMLAVYAESGVASAQGEGKTEHQDKRFPINTSITPSLSYEPHSRPAADSVSYATSTARHLPLTLGSDPASSGRARSASIVPSNSTNSGFSIGTSESAVFLDYLPSVGTKLDG